MLFVGNSLQVNPRSIDCFSTVVLHLEIINSALVRRTMELDTSERVCAINEMDNERLKGLLALITRLESDSENVGINDSLLVGRQLRNAFCDDSRLSIDLCVLRRNHCHKRA